MSSSDNIHDNLEPVEFDPFAGQEVMLVAPAIEPQLEIWISCIMGGDDANRSYNESMSFHFTGDFDRIAMTLALQAVINRHEALKSSFSRDGKQLCIYKEWPLELEYKDISADSPAEQQQFIAAFVKQNALTAFDLLNGPLFRTALFRLGAAEHYLTITVHHIICDGWSLGILFQDLGKLYSAYAKGETPDLPVAQKFSVYAQEQLAFSKTKKYADIEKYWTDQYKDRVPLLNFPTDFPRPLVRTYKSRRDDYKIDPEFVVAIKAIGTKAGSSFVSTLLAAFELFVHRMTGQDEIVIGLPAAGQSATGNYSLIGHCVNLLPLKSYADTSLSFIDYLKKRKKEILNDYEHQPITFGSLLKKLNIPRDSSRVPLVPVVFNIDVGQDEGVAFHGLKHKIIHNPREYETFELFLNASGSEQSLIVEWSYNTQLFKPATIKKMMDDFESLLGEIVKNPDLKIKDMQSAGFNNIDDKLKEWNNTHSDYPKEKSLQDLLDVAAAQYRDKTAISFGDRTLSYEYVNTTSGKLAALLAGMGVGKGDIIGLAVDRSPEMVIGLLAILRAGAAYLPINPEYPQVRIEFMLEDAAVKMLITARQYKGQFQTKATELLIEDALAKLPESPVQRLPSVTGNDLAYVMYTSGSTGQPKGVQITHRSLVNLLLSMQTSPGMTPDDRLLAVTDISFDIAGLELYLPLITGAEIILADTETTKDGRLLMDVLKKENVTFMQATPSSWRMMLDAGWNKRYPLKILSGGEALPKDLADKLVARGGELWNMYGPTETTIWSTMKQVTANDGAVTIGRPISNTQVYILNKDLKPLPEGAIGEIYIAGDGMALGYLNLPELTASVFIDNPFTANKGEKIYRTGDLGKFTNNGEIEYAGRIDHQVKIRGHRIELSSVEINLAKQKGIKEVVVVVHEAHLVAYVVPDDTAGQTANKKDRYEQVTLWKQGLRKLLPNFMVPYEFVIIDKMPLTPNGKTDREELQATVQYAQRIKNDYIAPRTEKEKLIAGIWADVLHLEKVSINDDFFELGGHSQIAVQVMVRLEKETGARLPLASLFEAPTVEKLARLAGLDRKLISWNSLVPIKPGGSKVPLYLIHGYGLNVLTFKSIIQNMDPEQPVYGLQASGLDGAGDPSDKMEVIAAHYIAEILADNPGDTFALAGYSFGGVIAYEMAKQLTALGKEITMLGMFDAYIHNPKVPGTKSAAITRKVMRQFPKMAFVLKSLAKHPKATIDYQGGYIKRRLNELTGGEKAQEAEAPETQQEKLSAKYETAYNNYKITPYNGIIDVFRVKTRLYFIDDMEYLGWKRYGEKGVVIHEVSGDHRTFLLPPNDKEFAGIVQKTLDERAAQKNKKQ